MLLDLPDHLLQQVLSRCSFRQQAVLASTHRDLAASVDVARREAALARARDADGMITREALPRAGDLGLASDPVPTAGALGIPPYRHVLETFDRLVPPPPGPEGKLHRWYREAAELAVLAAQRCPQRPHRRPPADVGLVQAPD